MNWRKILTYGALAVGALLLLRFVVSLISGILGLLWAIITTAVTLLAIAGVVYGGYRLFSWARDTESSSTSDTFGEWRNDSTPTEPTNRVDTLKERYANGELSDDEFERRLEQALEGTSGHDRELHRERE